MFDSANSCTLSDAGNYTFAGALRAIFTKGIASSCQRRGMDAVAGASCLGLAKFGARRCAVWW